MAKQEAVPDHYEPRAQLNGQIVGYKVHAFGSPEYDKWPPNYHTSVNNALEEAACNLPRGIKAPPSFAAAQAGDGADGARKMDVGKAPVVRGFMKYFPRAINAVAMVSEYGARKYNDGSYKTDWQKVPAGLGRYHDAEGRHMAKAGLEDYDAESGLAHLAHGAWNAMAALELALLQKEVTLRQGNQVVDGAPVPDTFKELSL